MNQVSYLKIKNKEYNNELVKIVEALKKENVSESNLYKCACYITEHVENYKNFTDSAKLKENVLSFEKYMVETDNVYVVKDKTDRMECCQ